MAVAGRILGIDFGTKRIGLALTDPTGIVATGAGIFENDVNVLIRIAELVRSNDVQQIVVGMPYAPDGGKGQKGKEIEAFIARLRGVVSVPVETWDESFTSIAAQETMRRGGMKKKQRREKGRVDEMAARLLLQEYLENHG
jgi:putative Holliday junction resolvase